MNNPGEACPACVPISSGVGIQGNIGARGALFALCLLAGGLGEGCAKRPWEIGHASRPRPVAPRPGKSLSSANPGEKDGNEAQTVPAGGKKGGRKVGNLSNPSSSRKRPAPGSRRGPIRPVAQAGLLSLPPPYPWPPLRPPGWGERREPWDPVAWFEALRKTVRPLPAEWLLRREARLQGAERAWRSGVPSGGKLLSWSSLPELPPLRGGRDMPEGARWRGKKALLAGFLLRLGKKGPFFLVPSLFGLEEGKEAPGPGERVLLRFEKGRKPPPPFSALLVLGRLQAEPSWSRDTLVAAFSLVPETLQVLPGG